MRQNLKAIDQKISNIVNVIANTGSAALTNQLIQLENEKEVILPIESIKIENGQR